MYNAYPKRKRKKYRSYESYQSYENFSLKGVTQKVADKVKEATANVTGGVKQTVENAKEEINKATQNISTSTQNAVKNAGSTVEKLKIVAETAGGNVRDAAEVALLIPYVPVMTLAIKRKGLQPATGVKNIATQFYTQVMGKASYEAFEAYMSIGNGSKGESFDWATIVPIIVQFLMGLMDLLKKEASPEGELAIDASKELMKVALQKGKDSPPIGDPKAPGGNNEYNIGKDGESESGTKKESKTGLIFGGVAALAAVILIFK